MRYCICGATIPRRQKKGGREKEYCSDKCRQRACRQRNKVKHNLDRARREAEERMWSRIEQNVHRETWQDDLEKQGRLIKSLLQDLEYTNQENDALRVDLDFL